MERFRARRDARRETKTAVDNSQECGRINQSCNEDAKQNGQFKEAKHPRDANGKFTGNGNKGSSKGKPEVIKSNKHEAASKSFQQRCLTAFSKVKTSDGRVIEKVHDHAMFQMEARKINPREAAEAVSKGVKSAGNKSNRLVYSYKRMRVVYDTKEKTAVTCICGSSEKSKDGKKGK